MEKTLPEAHAVAFTNFKRTDGFEVSITLRGDNGTEVLERLGKAIEQIKKDGGEPITRGYQKSSTMPQISTKLCETHNVTMKEKTSKTSGKKYYSHWEGQYPDLGRQCFGKGFQEQI